jgi:serine/threonine protein kinase
VASNAVTSEACVPDRPFKTFALPHLVGYNRAALLPRFSVNISAGTKLGRYQIRAKLGEGGMGEVYLARDTRLDRQVALKVLPADVGADRSRMNRFVQEAKATSALNHPNIITIYEIEEGVAGHFIATEFVDGETLRERLRKAPLKVSEALDIGSQIATALAAAHHAGIIHRDIKPENVMIRTDGLVKVLDFGLAKLTPRGLSDPDAATQIQSETQPGMIMGTVAYMSPEQARGQKVDRRTDVWSLGVVLYEMLSGQQPFHGETPSDTLANILHREPEPLPIQMLPAELVELLSRMLAKNLEARYETISDAATDIRQLQRRIELAGEPITTVRSSPTAQTEVIVSSSSSRTSPRTVVDSAASRADEGFWVAILPFKFTGSSAELPALADGLLEEIITGLSRFSYLRVIARSSASRSAGESADVRSIGNELGARYVMEGSLRQAGARLRLAVQLVDTTSGVHLWAENYEHSFDPESIFELQDDLVPRIVSTVADLHGVLPRSMSDAVRSRPPEQLSPYEAVLRSFAYAAQVTREALTDAISALESAVQKAPAYADAWALLASMLSHDHAQGFKLKPDALVRAEAAARKAIELAPSNHLAWVGLAYVHFFQKESESFRNAAERAVALNPMDGNSLASLGELLIFIGDGERGLALSDRAKQLNPNHPGWYWYANFYQAYRDRDYRAALNFVLKANLPGHWAQHMMIAAACGQLGESESAAKAVADLLKLHPLAAGGVREGMAKWWSPADVEHLIDGLRKAGMKIGD